MSGTDAPDMKIACTIVPAAARFSQQAHLRFRLEQCGSAGANRFHNQFAMTDIPAILITESSQAHPSMRPE